MRYEALQVDLKNNDRDGSSSMGVLSKFSQPTPSIKTASIKEKNPDGSLSQNCHSIS